jgi:hypothetical protein
VTRTCSTARTCAWHVRLPLTFCKRLDTATTSSYSKCCSTIATATSAAALFAAAVAGPPMQAPSMQQRHNQAGITLAGLLCVSYYFQHPLTHALSHSLGRVWLSCDSNRCCCWCCCQNSSRHYCAACAAYNRHLRFKLCAKTATN